jgi:hypothetical protein
MAAILTDRLLGPHAGASLVTRALTLARRRPAGAAGIFKTIWRAVAEWLVLLWLLGIVVFSLLMMAGATGLLG